MAIKIKSEVLEEIVAHGERDYPREACGLLLGQGDGVVEVYAAENLRADEREDRYLINPDYQIMADKRAQEKSLDIIGCYHSHPDWPAKPSQNDLENSWPGYFYIIVSIEKGKMADARAWRIDDSEKAFEEVPLEQR